MMILSQTAAYIQSELTSVILGIIMAGCVVRVVEKGIQAQTEGLSWEECMKNMKKPIIATIISMVIMGLVVIIKKYYTN